MSTLYKEYGVPVLMKPLNATLPLVYLTNGYKTAELNSKLSLSFQGLSEIEFLEEFTGLKYLSLECNLVAKIENISHMKHLQFLDLQQNKIEIIENLEKLTELKYLNLSKNSISKLENLSCLTKLHTLEVSHNNLHSANDITELIMCRCISVLYMTHNKLFDTKIIDVLSQMPELNVLKLEGNPVINSITYYQRTLVCALPALKCLEGCNVSDVTRATSMEYFCGGLLAERAEQLRWNQMEEEKMRKGVDSLYTALILGRENSKQDDSQSNESDFGDFDVIEAEEVRNGFDGNISNFETGTVGEGSSIFSDSSDELDSVGTNLLDTGQSDFFPPSQPVECCTMKPTTNSVSSNSPKLGIELNPNKNSSDESSDAELFEVVTTPSGDPIIFLPTASFLSQEYM